jgi:hypothetical protein
MKQIFFTMVFLLSCLPMESGAQWPLTQNAVFTSVEGKVTVTDNKGMERIGQKDSEAYPGETVMVAGDSRAGLSFFDGSVVELRPNTRFRIVSLKHPNDRQKELRFSLMTGWVLAKVRKLTTTSSLFEVEAGGVICGVRGTQFSVGYEPDRELVELKVLEGAVYAKTDGMTHFLDAGDQMKFDHGRVDSRLRQDAGSAVAGIQKKAPELNRDGALSLGLMDLNSQFMSNISVNGMGLAANPSLGGVAAQQGFQLTTLGSLVPLGLPITLP